MSDKENYFYSKDTKTLGPFDADKVSKLIQDKQIGPNDWVHTSSINWVATNSFTEFRE